jgi:hypothetical protein
VEKIKTWIINHFTRRSNHQSKVNEDRLRLLKRNMKMIFRMKILLMTLLILNCLTKKLIIVEMIKII